MAGPHIIPGLRVHDAPAAIDWLCEALGFERHLVVEDDGQIAHAQLRLGDDMIMLGSVREDPFAQWTGTVRETGGKNTMCCYLVVDDVDAHHDRAKAAGAEIVDEPRPGVRRAQRCVPRSGGPPLALRKLRPLGACRRAAGIVLRLQHVAENDPTSDRHLGKDLWNE